MFVVKAYNPNNNHFKHISHNNSTSKTSIINKTSQKKRLQDQKHIFTHINAPEKHSKIQNECIQHFPPYPPDLSVYSTKLNDNNNNDIDENDEYCFIYSENFPIHPVEEINISDYKEDAQHSVSSLTTFICCQ